MSKKNNKLKELRKNRIHKGKAWWKNLSQQDKNAFISGFYKNKRANEIQKAEIESNRQRSLNQLK